MTKKINWNVMIYMAGDNNLSIDMAYALETLQKKVNQNEKDNIRLFVHYINNSPEIPPVLCDFSDSKSPSYLYSYQINDKLSEVEDARYSISEAIDPLIDFAYWSVKQVKKKPNINKTEEKYVLILSGHTMGFISSGLLKDESKDVCMNMPDLKKGIKIIKEKIIKENLSILGFDSCVMSMFEVGYQFKNLADTMIASEGSIPNAGWSYAEILGSLNKNKLDSKHIAEEFVYKYINKQAQYAIGGVSVDMSAWNMSKLNILNNKFKGLVINLLKCFENENSLIYAKMRHILLQVHYDCQTYMCDQNIDLGDFCSLLKVEIEGLKFDEAGNNHQLLKKLSTNCTEVMQAVKDSIILSGYSGGEYQYSTGISLFFPWSLPAYEVTQIDYEQLSFVQKTEAGKLWNKFLQIYLTKVSRRKTNTYKQITPKNPIPLSILH